jgi:rhamnose transport system substrate-binding protein
MADMARSILGEDGGKFAVLSASPDAANQNAWIESHCRKRSHRT